MSQTPGTLECVRSELELDTNSLRALYIIAKTVNCSLGSALYILQVIRAHGSKVDTVAILPPLLRTMKDSELMYKLGEITSLAYGKLAHVRKQVLSR